MQLKSTLKTIAYAGLIALLLAPLWRMKRVPVAKTAGHSALAIPPSTVAPVASPVDLAAALGEGLVYPATPVLRPLPVSRSSDHHEWTRGDGRDPGVIHLISHNEAEFRRLIEENDRISRRQLVYRKDVIAAGIQRSRLTGEPVRHIVLPGFDGQEFAVDVLRADLSPSGQAGSLTGKLAGQDSSIVTLAFQFGREAFTILSRETGIYLQAHPRESGEIILTGFDPATYTPQRGGEPIFTQE
ncbi:hypothetical protein IMCC26134_14265 [Verrucomicrobia bacterium IMCC26134]|jgi:hypothetical protein|nr:hypothetical protein IMCC26134_14265 [Verrucomicrobia bacterium IMCC26134]